MSAEAKPADVTAASADCQQTTDASVTPWKPGHWDQLARELSRDERDEIVAESEWQVWQNHHDPDAMRGQRWLARHGRSGTSQRPDLAPFAQYARDAYLDLRVRQRVRERIQLIEHTPEDLKQLAVALHMWLEKEPEINANRLNDAAYRMVQSKRVKGAHWRILDCAGCDGLFVVYHRPRATLCTACQAQLSKNRDAHRKANERAAERYEKTGANRGPWKCACGAVLDAQRSTRRYCSAACRQTAYRMRRIEGAPANLPVLEVKP